MDAQWKILIADDEPKIRRGLHAEIERMNLPVCVCAEAEDGERALEAVEQFRPDILLVDVNMPFINGLDFVQKLRRTNVDARVILVTGYEEFDYARRALELGIHAYLLKPVDTDELRRTIASAIGALDAERARNRHFEWAILQINRRREYLREEFLRDAVSGRLEADEIREFRVYFDFPVPKRLRLMLISVRSNAEDEKPWQHLLRQYSIQDVLEGGAVPLEFCCLFSDDRGNVLMLYDVPEAEEASLQDIVRTALNAEGGIIVQIECASVESLTRLSEAYEDALERLASRSPRTPAVSAAVDYIETHCADPDLGLNEVAQAVNIHPTYLSRMMKRELGMPFARYVTHVRIGRATRLMQDPSLHIWEVAERVGYSGGNYFSAAFKRVLGVSPADYRREDRRK